MPVLLIAPGEDPGRTRLTAALERLRARFPGTFLLVAALGSPPPWPPAADLDWATLPGPAGSPAAIAFRERLARAYAVDATVDLEEEVDVGLVARLTTLLPFEASARPGADGDALLARLATHLERGGNPRAVLRWLGPMGTEVIELAEEMKERGARPVEVRLSLAEVRAGFLRPGTGLAWMRALRGARRGISFQVLSATQEAWVALALSVLNRALGPRPPRRP